MKTFNFHLDTKVTTWMRTEFEIEAKSLEEAKQLAIGFHLEMGTTELPWEENMDTQEPMSVEENDNQPTEELYDEEGNIIWDNTKSI
jgi:hypothetical protein